MSDEKHAGIRLVEPKIDSYIIEGLYTNFDQLMKNMKVDKIKPENMVNITLNLMQMVERYPTLLGYQKKELVIYTLKKFAINHFEGEDETYALILMDTLLPSVIDSIISVDTGKIVINIKKKFGTWFSPCC